VFVTSHVLAGATIGALLGRRPAVAFAAGMASHFVMDACPHWGFAMDGPGAEARFLRVARRDGCAGLAAMATGAALASRRTRVSVTLAMAGAALPDLDKPFVHFFDLNPFPDWFQAFHERIQNESPDLLGHELRVGGLLGVLAGAALAAGRRVTDLAAWTPLGSAPPPA
jgi:hypothetical protein